MANKIDRQRKDGFLSPHEVPVGCWVHITANFITELNTSKRGKHSVLVVGKNLSKQVMFMPTT